MKKILSTMFLISFYCQLYSQNPIWICAPSRIISGVAQPLPITPSPTNNNCSKSLGIGIVKKLRMVDICFRKRA